MILISLTTYLRERHEPGCASCCRHRRLPDAPREPLHAVCRHREDSCTCQGDRGHGEEQRAQYHQPHCQQWLQMSGREVLVLTEEQKRRRGHEEDGLDGRQEVWFCGTLQSRYAWGSPMLFGVYFPRFFFCTCTQDEVVGTALAQLLGLLAQHV